MISARQSLAAIGLASTSLLLPLVAPATAEAAKASVTSAGWVSQLGKAGLSQYRSDPQAIPLPSVAAFQAEVAAEPAGTTAKLSALAARESANSASFDRAHPALSALLKADAQIQAGNTLSAQSVNGLLPATPYYNYLRFRRALDPARFDHCHPNLGPMLALDARIRAGLTNGTTTTPTSPTAPVTPPTAPITTTGQQSLGPNPDPTVPGGPVPAGIVNPPAPNGGPGPVVPEPGSALLMVLGAGTALACRVRKARKATAAA